MPRRLIAAFFSCVLVCFVVPCAASQAKLSPQELAVRKEKAAGDPVRLLELVPLADPVAAAELRRHIARVLAQMQVGARAEQAGKLAPLVPGAAQTPEELKQLLGTPERISRHVVYRRCIEQWTYDVPLPLCVNWQAAAGQEMQIHAVHPLPPKNR
jgi:hypothetical protein